MANPNPDTTGRDNAPRCTKLRQRDRQPCRSFAVRGSNPPACRKHLGRSVVAVRAEEAVREAVINWGFTDSHVEPGELLLRLVSQSAARAVAYAAELERIVAAQEDGDLRKALTGNTYTVTGEGESVKTGEYIRAITKLEADERDRAANFAAKAVAAGIAERQVRLAESQGALLAEVIRRILGDLDLTAEQSARVGEVVPRHLRAVAG